MNISLITELAEKRQEVRNEYLKSLPDEKLLQLKYNWKYWARPEQLPPPGDWTFWLVNAGRGFGKSRTGAEWIIDQIRKGFTKIGLIGSTASDIRDIMVEGDSGILTISRPDFRPLYEPSKRKLTWPNGAIAHTYSAEEPDRLRGPQFEKIWADELATWKYPEAWDMAKLSLRLGRKPQAVITTTPKPKRVLKELIADKDCVVTGGSTYDNIQNLAESFYKTIVDKYEGTTLGQQEIYAVLLEELPDALWQRAIISKARVSDINLDELVRIVVGIDPSGTKKESSAETGILVCGVDANLEGYVIDDLSCRKRPEGWVSEAIKAYYKYKADRIIAEVNFGGDMVESVIRNVDPNVSYKSIYASRGKRARAEPVSALYEKGRIHHVGVFKDLEDQQCNFTPEIKIKVDRIDALVWCFTELIINRTERRIVRAKSISR
ncbi:hypothetical protein ES703_67325 [subsurface metagenome]